jgi:hypothetical protein
MNIRVSLVDNQEDANGLPCTFVMSENSDNVTTQRMFGACHAYDASEIGYALN